MKKGLLSYFIIISCLASMLVAPARASSLSPANKSYGMYDLLAGSDSSAIYSAEYVKDSNDNTTEVTLTFLKAENSKTNLIKYVNTDGTDAKFVHNRLLVAFEDCGVDSQDADKGCGFRVAHYIGEGSTRQINISPSATSIFDGNDAARGYALTHEITFSTTDNPFYNVFDWIWDCENGIEYYFMNGSLAAYVTNAANNGKFYGYALEKMDDRFDAGDIISAKFDSACPGHTIYKDTDSYSVTIDDVLADADIENCNYDSYRTLINARLKDREANTHRQTKEYNVTGSGLVIQAEDAYFTPSYILKSDRLASGTMSIYSQGYFPSAPGKKEPAHCQVDFTVSETASYNIWLRGFASSSKCDQLYISLNDGAYESYKVIRETGNYEWNCVKITKLVAGEKNTLKLKVFEGGNYVDCFLITPIGTFKPSGRLGNLPSKYDENSSKLVSAKYNTPKVNPPKNVHPRVLFRKEDIPKIKANLTSEQNASAFKNYNNLLSGTISPKYSITDAMRVQAYALDYALNKNIEHGRAAIEAILSHLVNNSYVGAATIDDSTTRGGGHIIYVASQVYDWCYNLLTDAEKKEIISGCEALALSTENGWPPESQGVVTGHGSEAQFQRDIFALAIATYDERPDIWNFVGGRYYDYYVPVRQMFLTGLYQGGSYGQYRQMWTTWAYVLLKGMGAELPVDAKELAQMEYWSIYFRRPDGQTLRDGDEAQDNNYKMWKYWNTYPSTLINTVALSGDKYLKYEFARRTEKMEYYNGSLPYASPIEMLILNDATIEPAKSFDDLPLSKYFGSPYGLMVARTGWDDGVESPSVVAEMKVMEWYTSNHQHLDAGHFQIYYKGILASDSGVYQGKISSNNNGGAEYWSEHANQYATKSIAHNCMLVYDPKEGDVSQTGRGTINDGGQRQFNGGGEFATLDHMMNRFQSNVGTVEGNEIDPKNTQKPAYTYLKGNLTNAYTDKVSDYKRSFMFLNLDNEEVPAAMIVFDKIDSSDETFKKIWLLHGLEEPDINGNQTIFRRTYHSGTANYGYNGKLTVDTLLPKENTISKVGGEGMWSYVNGIDYTGYPLNSHTDEGNTWRMELSPKNPSKEDYFLNVLQVSDNDKENYLPTQMFESNEFYGAVISDRAVAFSKSGNRVGNSFELEIPTGKKYQYTICDVEVGEYTVSVGGNNIDCFVTQEGGVLSFEGEGGKVEVSKVGNKIKAQPETVISETTTNNVTVRINDVFIYNKRPAVLRYDTVMIDPAVIEKQFGVAVVSGDNTLEMSRKGTTVTFTNGSDEYTVNGVINKMNAPATFTETGWEIPARNIVVAFGGSIDWDKFANRILITAPDPDFTLPQGYAKIINTSDDGGPVDYPAVNVTDELYGTHWAAEGTGRYITLELDSASTLSGIEISFNPHATNARDAEFEVAISNDGQKYTTIYKGVSDGSVDEGTWEMFHFDKPYTAKYVRYIGNGSNVNKWNAVKELRLKLQ